MISELITSIKPFGKRLIVQEIPTERRLGSGIFLPDTARFDRPRMFRVLKVGTVDFGPRSGDRVLCHSHHTGPAELSAEHKVFIIDHTQVMLWFPQTVNPQEKST